MSLLADVPNQFVWQCSMRLAEGDRRLTDPEWAQVAREVVERTGFAPADDPGGCRWVAVRHADDHIHIVAVLARQDAQPVNTFRDWPKVHAAARDIETRFELTTVPSPDRTATPAPTYAELAKARRQDDGIPARVRLTHQVRAAAAGSSSPEEFVQLLRRNPDVVLGWRYSQREPGAVTGYRVGRRGDVNADGGQVWFAGSNLSPDLSLPKLEARWAEAHRPGAARPLDLAAPALERAADRADRPGVAVSAAEVGVSVAQHLEGPAGGPLTDAAAQLSRATRQPRGARPPMNGVIHDLRHVALDIAALGAQSEPPNVLAVIGQLTRMAVLIAELKARTGQTSQSQAAARAGEAYQRYGLQVTGAEAQAVRTAFAPGLAEQVIRDPAWPTLAARLQRLQRHGVDAVAVLRSTAQQRELETARSPAAVLDHRLGTLALRPRGIPATPGPTRTSPQQLSRPRARGR